MLPCVGYFRDLLNHEIGLAFEPPPAVDKQADFTTLLQLYSRERIVPLGHRIRLAWALTTAVEHFHRVGWVHKSIRSENIALAPYAEPLTRSMTEAASADEGDASSGRLGRSILGVRSCSASNTPAPEMQGQTSTKTTP